MGRGMDLPCERSNMLIEISVLQNLALSNPNRDNTGTPKTMNFGGTQRSRISSACQKRSIRMYGPLGESLAGHIGARTKLFPEMVGQELKQSEIPVEFHERVMLRAAQIGKKEGSASETPKDGRQRTRSLIFLGPGNAREYVDRVLAMQLESQEVFEHWLNPGEALKEEIKSLLEEMTEPRKELKQLQDLGWQLYNHCLSDLAALGEGEEPPTSETPLSEVAAWLVARAASALLEEDSSKKLKALFAAVKKGPKEGGLVSKPKNFDKLVKKLDEPFRSIPIDARLFGRMVTASTMFGDVEACMEVAHAMSTNEVILETDYFTAMDDMDPGPAAHVGESLATSNCYYKYFSLDFRSFRNAVVAESPNKAEGEKLARLAVKETIRAALFSLPTGAKKGHANNNLPDAVLIEVRDKHVPTNYSNAFLVPSAPRDGDFVGDSIRKLGHYVHRIGSVYKVGGQRFWLDVLGRPLQHVAPASNGEPEKAVTYLESQPDFDTFLDSVMAAIPEMVEE
jgi:hypothetical protein